MSVGIELNLEPLQRSIDTFRRALTRYQSDTDDTEIRDSVIKRFEYTYEISISTLKKYLSQTSINPQGRGNSVVTPLQDLIREGHAQGILLGGWPQWHVYRDMRNKTSHTYDESTALKVASNAQIFLNEVEYFSERLIDIIEIEEGNKFPRPSGG